MLNYLRSNTSVMWRPRLEEILILPQTEEVISQSKIRREACWVLGRQEPNTESITQSLCRPYWKQVDSQTLAMCHTHSVSMRC